ncbi:MAG: site-specific integrase [Bifidobacteriaceae bacterium]|nr:site-specific integrase [Bifidobacteriaceae bacterium]
MPKTLGSLEWANAIAEWSSAYRGNLGAQLLLIYQDCLNRFSRAFAQRSPWSITDGDIDRHLAELGGAQAVDSRIALDHFYRWAADKALVASNPAAPNSGFRARPAAPRRQTASVSVDVRVALNPAPSDLWAKPIADWLAHLGGRGLSAASMRCYEQSFSLLRKSFPERSPWDLTAAELDAWFEATTWSDEHRKRMRWLMRRFFNWAVAAGRTDSNPLEFSAGPSAKPAEPAKPKAKSTKVQIRPAKRSAKRRSKNGNLWIESARAWSDAMFDEGLSVSTIRTYRGCLSSLRKFFANRSPWSLTDDDLRAWLARDNSVTNSAPIEIALKRFFDWGVDTGQIEVSPLDAPVKHGPAKRPPKSRDFWAEPVRAWSNAIVVEGLSVATVNCYRMKLNPLRDFFPGRSPWSLTGDDLRAWLTSDECAAHATGQEDTAVRRFFNWAVNAGRIEASPLDDFAGRVPAEPGPAKNCPWCDEAAFDAPRLVSIGEAWRDLRPVGAYGPDRIKLYRLDDVARCLEIVGGGTL